MKFKAFIILLSMFLAVSCTEDMLDVKFDADYITNLAVETDSAKAGKAEFLVMDTIDPTSDEEVKKYLEEIKAWDMKSLKGTFKNVSEDFVLVDGLIKISAKDLKAEWTLENVTGANAEEVILENLSSQFGVINQILEQKIPFVIEFSGTTNKENIDFDMEMAIKTEVTANPL